MKLELASRERLAHVGLDGSAYLYFRVHSLFEKAEGISPFRLRAIECQVGAFEQGIYVKSVRRGERDADTDADVEFMAIHEERLGHALDKPLGERLGSVRLLPSDL